MHRLAFGFVFAFLILACGGSGSSDPSSATSGDAPAAPAAGKATDIAKFGLKAELPDGATVGDAIIGDGVMIMGGGLGALTIDVATDMTPKTAADQQKEDEMFTPTNSKVETLPDGWTVTFENQGGAGTNYWMHGRRTIGGKDYYCGYTGISDDQRTKATAACKSLKQ